ncbi:MAG: prolyl oligopeptidase family serine peptidase [Myxococcales bacterium]|nr:prolyl oligopeptidase family serine peptidase [Myxococcales bacterium]
MTRPLAPRRSRLAPRSLLGVCVAAALGCGASPSDRAEPSASAPAVGSTTPSAASALPSAAGAQPSPSDATTPEVGPTCTTNGCLRWALPLGDYPREVLAAFVPPGVTLDNGYSLYGIELVTNGALARATIAVPFGVPAPPGGWHVVANNHGTSGLDDPCAVAGTLPGAGLAGAFGAHGLIGVATDYPGLGTPGVHPYLVSEVEGRAALDALRAARTAARLGHIPLSGRYAMVGLSQGGHATLAAAAQHLAYAPELDLRAFAVSGPASAWEEHWRAGAQQDGPFAAVHAMLFYAWADHYGYRGPPLWSPHAAPLIDEAMRHSCVVPFGGRPALATLLGSKMADIFAPELLAAYRSGHWGLYAPFAGYFAANRLRPYRQSAPLLVYQGALDRIVPEWATRELVTELEAGGVELRYEVVPDGHHIDVAFSELAAPQRRSTQALAWLRAALDAER